MPSRFWIVTRLKPTSRLKDVVAKCSFKRLASLFTNGFPIGDLAGIYARADDAIADARQLIETVRQCHAASTPPPQYDPHMPTQIVGIPSRFWMVKRPTTTSQVEDICVECSFMRLAYLFKRGLLIKDIAGFYAERDDAIDDAQALVEAIRRPQPTATPAAEFGMYPVEIVGMPSSFWIVKRPTPSSRIEDICIECGLPQLAYLVKHASSISDFAGVYAEQDRARSYAQVLLLGTDQPPPANEDPSVDVVGMPSRFGL